MRARLPFVVFGLAVGLIFNAITVLAWNGPSTSAPNGNVAAPVNVGTVAQVKNGDIGVNNFTAFGNVLISGLGVNLTASPFGRYLNFDYTSGGTSGTGAAGYGIRDNNGTLEFKNVGGVWASLQSTVSNLGSQWGNATRSTGFDYNSWTSALAKAGATRWIDGPSTNFNGPTGNNTGTLVQFDPLWNSSPDNFKMQLSNPDATQSLYWRNQYGGTWNGWNRIIMADSAGNVGIGISPSYRLQIAGAPANWTEVVNWPPGSPDAYGILVGTGPGKYSQFQNADGYFVYVADTSWGLYTNGNVGAVAFLYTSDRRLKKDIAPIPGSDALTKVLNLRPVTFNWIDPKRGAGNQIGFIAQDVKKIVPELVNTDASSTYESVDYARTTPLLVGATQELERKIEAQQKEIDDLKAEIEALKNK